MSRQEMPRAQPHQQCNPGAQADGLHQCRASSAAPRCHRLASLTLQERSVLELIGQGLTNRQIGARMLICEQTVKNYVSKLFRKLGMKQRTDAAAYAARILHGRPAGLDLDMWIIDRNVTEG